MIVGHLWASTLVIIILILEKDVIPKELFSMNCFTLQAFIMNNPVLTETIMLRYILTALEIINIIISKSKLILKHTICPTVLKVLCIMEQATLVKIMENVKQ